MAATLVWGKNLRLERVALETGRENLELVSESGGSTPISWFSVQEAVEMGLAHLIPEEVWPFYRGIDVESRIPLDEVRERSERLRPLLLALAPDVVASHYWLAFFVRLAREGHIMFVME